MNRDRIIRFRGLLEADRTNPEGVKFDMCKWAGKAGMNASESWDERPAAIPMDCGTNACAFGLAAISGIFEAEGLNYDFESGMIVPTFEGKYEYDAGAAFFEIGKDDAVKLFDPWEYRQSLRKGAEAEAEVIKRLDYLLSHGSLDNYSHLVDD